MDIVVTRLIDIPRRGDRTSDMAPESALSEVNRRIEEQVAVGLATLVMEQRKLHPGFTIEHISASTITIDRGWFDGSGERLMIVVIGHDGAGRA